MNSKMNRQRGMVLLVSLMLLLMLTLIAIAASSQSTLQVRIASNSEMRNAAFQAAEAGIAQWTKTFQQTGSPPNSNSGTTGDQAYEVTYQPPLPCPGGPIEGPGSATCFDLTAIGKSGCDIGTSNNCLATTVHRQGGQRRNEF